MNFTVFSLAMLTVFMVSVGIGAFKGYRLGTLKSFILLASNFAALILSILLSRLLSKWISSPILSLFNVSGSELLYEIFAMFIQILLGSSLFFVLFLIVRPIAKLVFRILLKVKLNGETPELQKGDRLGGIAVGVVTGILVAAALTSPLTGTVNLLNDTIEAVKLIDEELPEKVGLDEDDTDAIEQLAHDVPASICYCLGGKLIYSETAVGKLGGHTVRIVHEIDAVKEVTEGLAGFAPSLSGGGAMDFDRIDVDQVCRGIESSTLMKVLATEFMSVASETWLDGDKYLGISRPNLGENFNPIVDEVLLVTSTVTTDCITNDISTLLNVLEIIIESGVLNHPENFTVEDYAELAEALSSELEKNPRMLGIRESLWGIAVGTAFDELTSSLDDEEMDSLMSELATYLNRINGSENYTYEQKIENLTSDLSEALEKYQISLPETLSSLTAEMIIAEYDLFDGTVTAEELEEILRQYAK